jgi:hypothetical protein
MKRFVSACITLGAIAAVAPGIAAPVTVSGASFDAPASCITVESALVCKLDGQQFELWVTRKPLAPDFAPTDPMAKKMEFFTEAHEIAVTSIMRSTGNDSPTQFSNYGTYSAMGTALPGKGVPTSPTVRFASVLHDEAIWEFMEVVAVRTPAVDALSSTLQSSLKLPNIIPAPKPVAEKTASTGSTAKASAATTSSTTPSGPVVIEPTAPDAWFESKLLKLQYPTFLEPTVAENSDASLNVVFKHKTLADGPRLTILLRANSEQLVAAAAAARRKAELTATMAGKSASVDIAALGTIQGAGFALLGVPDPAKGLSGVESIETVFVADVAGRQLHVQMSTAQKNSGDAQAVWGLLSKSIVLH